MFAIRIQLKEQIDRLLGFRRRMDWFLKHKPHLARYVAVDGSADREIEGSYFIELVPKDRLLRLLSLVLDETKFFSEHGVRSLSRYHLDHPFEIDLAGKHITVRYTPAE